MAAFPATYPPGRLFAAGCLKQSHLLCFALYVSGFQTQPRASASSFHKPACSHSFLHGNHLSRGSRDPTSVPILLVLLRQIDAQKGGVHSLFMFVFFVCLVFSAVRKLSATSDLAHCQKFSGIFLFICCCDLLSAGTLMGTGWCTRLLLAFI